MSSDESSPGPADTSADPSPRSRVFLDKQESSVRHLQALYTIVSGLALSDAISTIVREDIDGRAWVPTGALLVAFVVTLVPFFHGAMRHLDDTFIIDASPRTKPRALAVDFAFLFAEGILLFLLAHWIVEPGRFAWALIALLVVDVCWTISTELLSEDGIQETGRRRRIRRLPRSIAQKEWTVINLLTIPVLVVFGLGSLFLSLDPTVTACGVGLASLVRTTADYQRSWSFYFPARPA